MKKILINFILAILIIIVSTILFAHAFRAAWNSSFWVKAMPFIIGSGIAGILYLAICLFLLGHRSIKMLLKRNDRSKTKNKTS